MNFIKLLIINKRNIKIIFLINLKLLTKYYLITIFFKYLKNFIRNYLKKIYD